MRLSYVALFAVLGLFLFSLFFAIAANFIDDTQAEFDAGTYSNTAWDTNHIELSSGQTSGTFTSKVFDGGLEGTVSWTQLGWSETLTGVDKLIVVDTGAKIWKSVDNGAAWTQINSDYNSSDGNNATDMVVDGNKNIFIVDAQDVWKSTDAGINWTRVSDDYNGSETNNAQRIAVDSSNQLYVAEADEDIWRSTDGGASWSKQSTNINGGNGNIFGLTSVGTTLFAVDDKADVWKSTDGGASWTLIKDDYTGSESNGGDYMTSDPSGNLYILFNQDVWKSTDSGGTWTKINDDYNGSENNNGLIIKSNGSNHLFIAEADEDVWRSTDGGSAWTKQGNTGGVNTAGMVYIPVSTDITFSARSGNTNPPTDSFSGTLTNPSGGDPGVANNRYFQYQATFTSGDSSLTPELTSVTVTYSLSGGDTTAPGAITNLAVQSTATTTVTLTWTAPGDNGAEGTAASYDVRYSTSIITSDNWSSANQATGEPIPSAASSTESMTVSGLSSGTTYYFAIKAADEVPNTSGLSNVVSGTTTGEADTNPPALSSVLHSNVTQDSAQITWNTDESSDSQVDYGTTVSYGSQTTLNTTMVTSHSVTISGLSPNKTYNYRVKSRDAAGNLAVSGNSAFTTPALPVSGGGTNPIISKVSTSSVTNATATITWQTDQDATSRVEYGTTTEYGSFTEEQPNLTREHRVEIGNLEPETKYNFRAISRNAGGLTGTSENFSLRTKEPPPPPPPPPENTEELCSDKIDNDKDKLIDFDDSDCAQFVPANITDVAVAAVQPNSAKITWKTDAPATSQIIFGAKSGELTQVTIEFVSLSKNHSMVVSDLEPETVYYFVAVSRNAVGREARSKEGSFKTQGLEIQTVVSIEKPVALPPGSPGTQVPKTSSGEMVTAVPILPTKGDTAPPDVTLFAFDENPTENTSPNIRGRAQDRGGVIAGISYSTDGGASWHPVTQVAGIGSSAASFSAKIPNLIDGNYNVLFRVRDNSDSIGRSNARTLIIDVHPPATGASGIFLGSQPTTPSALGTISAIVGIAERLVISSIGGATSVDVIARKITSEPEESARPLTEGLAETSLKPSPNAQTSASAIFNATLERGDSHPDIKRLQTFLNSDPDTQVAESGSGSPGSEVEYFGPGTLKALQKFQEKHGVASSGTSGYGTLGPATRAKLQEVFAGETAQNEDDGLVFPMAYSPQSSLWSGDMQFENPDSYQLWVRAVDGANRVSLRPINSVSVAKKGRVSAKGGGSENSLPLENTKISVFQFSSKLGDFVLWPAEAFGQTNPAITANDGTYQFIVPKGKYFLKVEKGGFRKLYTPIMNFSSHKVINFDFALNPLPAIPVPIPFAGTLKIHIPMFPDFFKAEEEGEHRELSASYLKSVNDLINKPAPLFVLPDSQGEPVDIRYLRGKKTIISTWATWSPLAQSQVPIFDGFMQREGQEISIILLSLHESGGKIQTYVRRGKYKIASIVDKSGEITDSYPILTIPQHFFIDRKGIIKDVYIGFLDNKTLEEKLGEL